MAYINKIVVNGQEVNANQLEGILDKDGHARFIEGDGTSTTQEGLTVSYCKWSLSGSHLMLVFAGALDANYVLTDNQTTALFALPEWIMNKIFPVAGYNTIEIKDVNVFNSSSISIAYTEKLAIQKLSNGIGIFIPQRAQTAPAYQTTFRAQFDLLIDND